jgi:hypothetical protein
MPNVLMNKKPFLHKQNIFQNQSKRQKNGEAHGDVRQDKRVDSRARIRVDQPAVFADPMREDSLNTAIPRTKKRSTKRRLLQITGWIDKPLMLQVREHAHDKKLSMSEAVRGLLREMMNQKLAKHHEAALPEMIDQRIARGNRALASRLVRLLAWLLYDTGQIKALANNTLGMQKGMTEQLHKDIIQDADRQTKTRFARQNPDLAAFMDAIEQWLLRGEGGETTPGQDHASPRQDTNGHSGRGGRLV